MTRSAVWIAPLLIVGGIAHADTPAPYCSGDYADDYSALTSKAREVEQSGPVYTFCIRTAATYECPSYGPDGNLRRKKRRVVAHGTGFAYQQEGGETLLLTNQHVAEWPAVTDDEHRVDDVPAGCKRVSDTINIVDNDEDAYERDDIPLTRVAADPQLDMAILKAKAVLPILPWKLGHSGGLHERNVVDVRGFPLGVFKATNVGKVVSPYDHDSYKEWEHDDFVVDALLSSGNSGSPVFAISCKTGEFELVGIYHAGYTRGSALNLVIGVDQLRDFLTTHKRTPKPRSDANIALNAGARRTLTAASRASIEPFFPFGPLPAAVRVRDDDVLVYEILNHDFPLRAYPVLVIEDLPSAMPDQFGSLGAVWIGNRHGLKRYAHADLDADTQAQLVKLLDGLRHNSVTAFAVRAADDDDNASVDGKTMSREKYERTARLEQNLVRTSAGYGDLAQAASDLAERLGPQASEPPVSLKSALVTPPQPRAIPGITNNVRVSAREPKRAKQ